MLPICVCCFDSAKNRPTNQPGHDGSQSAEEFLAHAVLPKHVYVYTSLWRKRETYHGICLGSNTQPCVQVNVRPSCTLCVPHVRMYVLKYRVRMHPLL